MNRKLIAYSITVIALLALLAACSQPPETSTDVDTVEEGEEVTPEVEETPESETTKTTTGSEPSEEEVVTITWWGTERGRDTAAARDLHFQLARAFEESHPNTKIAVSLFPSRGFANRVLPAIAAGEGPDIFYHYFATDIATQGFLEDLTPYIEESGIDPEERWFPIGRQRAVYEGRYYGVPRDATAGVIAYNKDLFDAAGVPYPEEGWTIADYREAALALTDPGKDQYGVGAIVGSSGCFQWSAFSYNMGAAFVSPDGRDVVGYLDSSEAIDALKFCMDLTAEDKVAAPSGMQEQYGELVFLSGQIAMQHISTWELAAIQEEADFEWGVVSPPRADDSSEGIAWTDAYVYYMWSGSPHKKRAWEFLEWLSGPEAGKIIAETGIWTPAVPLVWEEMGWPEDETLGVFWNELNKETRVPNYLRSQYYWDCVGGVFDNVWSSYVELGERDNLANFVSEETAMAQSCLDDSYGQ